MSRSSRLTAQVSFLWLAVLGPAATASGAPPVRLFPGVARLAGANNTAWRASAVVLNPTASPQQALLELLPRDTGAVSASQTMTLAPGETREIANLYDFLGAPDGAGMLRVTGSVATWVRSYNEGGGTFGQDLPPVVPGGGFSAVESRVFPISTPADAKRDFRSNLMLVNLDPADITVTMTVGAVTATKSVPAGAYVQISNLGGFLGLPAGFAAVALTADGPWYAAISTIDPFTGDPTTVRGLSPSDVGERDFPGIAQKAGLNGAAWRSEAVFYNPGDAPVSVQLSLVPRGSGQVAAAGTVTLGPAETRRIANLYEFLGASDGAGTLHVTGAALAWVRTYNQRPHPGGTAMETFGQDLPPVGRENVVDPGAFAVLPFANPADVASGFRSNLVLLNLEVEDITVSLRAGGVTKTQSVPAGSYVQIDKLGPFLGVPVGVSSVWATADGRWSTAISTIDPTTNDPTTFRAVEGLQPPSSYDIVDQALAAGTISQEQALTYKVFADFADPRLPALYAGDDRGQAEPSAVAQAARSFSSLSPATQALIGPFLVPPFMVGSWWDLRHGARAGGLAPARAAGAATCLPWLTACGFLSGTWEYEGGTHARVWYLAANRATDLAIADDLVSQAEYHIWAQLLSVTGTQALTHDLGDGQPHVDIALVDEGDLDPETAGLTVPYSGACQKSADYIMIKRTLGPLKRRRATLAHELMHAFQDAFNTNQCTGDYRWLHEATATWFEDYSYPDGDTEHAESAGYLTTTHLSLDDRSIKYREYSAYMFFFYLTRVRGVPATVMGDIFKATETADALHALDTGIKKNGTDLDTVWPDFAVHNLNEAPFDDYTTKDRLPLKAKMQRTSDLAATGGDSFTEVDGSSAVTLPHLSIRYFRFDSYEWDKTVSVVAAYNGLGRALNRVQVPTFGEALSAQDAPDPDAVKGAHIDLVFRINGQWKHEAITDKPARTFCRDLKSERFDSLIVILSNSDISTTRTITPPGRYAPGLFVSNVGCAAWEAFADLTFKWGNLVTERMLVQNFRADFKTDGYSDPNTPLFRVYTTTAGTCTWAISGTDQNCTYTGQASGLPLPDPLNSFMTLSYVAGGLGHRGFVSTLFYQWLTPSVQAHYTCKSGGSGDKPWSGSEFYLETIPGDVWSVVSADGKWITINAAQTRSTKGLSGTWTLQAKREP